MAGEWLLERMQQWHNEPAMIWHDEPTTYGELVVRTAEWRTVLQEWGVQAGSVVAFEGDYSPGACSLLLALIAADAIAVPLTRAIRSHRDEFLAIAEAQLVIDFDEHDDYRVSRLPADVSNALTRALIERGEPGLIVFSSGSTGKNKAALHSFSALLEKFLPQRSRQRTLTFLLLDHLGGINTLLYTLSNGGVVVSVVERDPELICRAIERHRVEMLPTSPTFLNMLLISEAYRRYDLASLRLITYGTEAMPELTLQRLCEAFPAVRLQQTYGLSEVGVLRSKSRESGSLWVKIGGEGFETKIIDNILWIRARSAMLGYLNAPSPFDADGWMNTQDMVEVDGDYVRILGRVTEIINVGGQKVYPAEVEGVLQQMPNIRDVAVFGQPNPITGQMVVARVNLFEAERLSDLKNRMYAFCQEKLATYKIPAKLVITEDAQHNMRFKKMRRAE